MSRTLVIAEPGCTAEGNYDTYIRLIETAAQCGADCIKPQWVSNPARMCERRHIDKDHPKREYYERAYSWLSFPLEWHAWLGARAVALGMQYAATVFLPEDVEALTPFVDILKVSSFENEDEELILACERTGHMLIISSGMHDEGWHYTWCGNAVLHCTSAYPAPVSNLRVILNGGDDGPRYSGLSDHSRNVLAGAVAVGAGAEIIEAHYRLEDCSPDNPDFAVAFSPDGFAAYIKNIREAESLMGDGQKRIQDCEREMLSYKVAG